MVSVTEENAGKAEMAANVQAQKNWNKGKSKDKGKAKVELVEKIRAHHVVFLVVKIIFCGSARSCRNLASF